MDEAEIMSDHPPSAGLGQPLLGLLALAGILAVSFAVMAAFPPDVFNTWVAFLAMTIIPTQIVCGLVWHCEHPAPIARLPQPLKGLAYLLLCVTVGAIAALVSFRVVGGGIAPPTPPLIMYVILSIVVTFWFVVVWGAWPISALPVPPTVSGLLSVAFCYMVAYGLFELLFDFSFLKGAPFYSAAIDPHGLFVAWTPLVFGVTSVAVITFAALCDFWPVTLIRKPGGPLFSLLASVYVLGLAAAVFYCGVAVLRMDMVQFLVTAPVPFIFGFFIVLSLLQKWPFARLPQPLGGAASSLAAAAAGAAMHWLYLFAAPFLTGRTMASGAPAYQRELWLASAMLAVTFPLIVFLADLLGFWPLRRAGSK
jgi:hypothetical protein